MPNTQFDYNQEALNVVNVLRDVFPTDTIDTSEGYNGHVHVKLVSRLFNGKSEADKQTYIWDMLREKLGDHVQAISLVLVYGTDEL